MERFCSYIHITTQWKICWRYPEPFKTTLILSIDIGLVNVIPELLHQLLYASTRPRRCNEVPLWKLRRNYARDLFWICKCMFIYLSDLWIDLVKRFCINWSPLDKNGHHFADDIFNCILMDEKFCILIRIALKFPKGPIDIKWALVQVMVWRRIGPTYDYLDQIWSSSLRHLCDTRRGWVKSSVFNQ